MLNFVIRPIVGRGTIIKTISNFQNEWQLRQAWDKWKQAQGFEGVLFDGDREIDCFPLPVEVGLNQRKAQ